MTFGLSLLKGFLFICVLVRWWKTSFIDLLDWRQTPSGVARLVFSDDRIHFQYFIGSCVSAMCCVYRRASRSRGCVAFLCSRRGDQRSSPSSSFPLNLTRQTDPLNRCERADVSSQLAATASLDLSSAALHNERCSLQDAGARAAFCPGPQWRGRIPSRRDK